MNTAVHRGFRHSPFFLFFGKQPGTVVNELCGNPPLRLTREEWFTALSKARELSAALEGRIKLKNKKKHDDKVSATPVAVGDKVFVDFAVTSRGKSKKLAPKRQGPYTVKRLIDPVTLEMEHAESGDVIVRHINSVSKYVENADGSDHHDNSFEVDRIVAERPSQDGTMQLLVRFKGYSSEHDLWYAEDELPDCQEVIADWKKKGRRQKNKVLIDRVVRHRGSGRRRQYLVAMHADDGPEQFEWKPMRDIIIRHCGTTKVSKTDSKLVGRAKGRC